MPLQRLIPFRRKEFSHYPPLFLPKADSKVGKPPAILSDAETSDAKKSNKRGH
jgi:hypothetical protein